MPELVSILIPAYNAERWLGATIRSALAQTWTNTEVIVVDDGSRDGTLKVARTFENKKVRVVTQPNSGAPAARNRAFELSQGDYIQWLDADDLLDPNKIQFQLEAARETGNPRVMFAGPFGTFYYRVERAAFRRTSLWRDTTPVDYLLTRFTENAFFQTAAWLVSRELSEATGPWIDFDSPDDDGEYFCRMVVRSAGVKFVETARMYYRVGNYGGLNKARSTKAQNALFLSKRKSINYLLSMEDSPRARAACVQLLNDWVPEFYPSREDIVAEMTSLAASLGGTLSLPTPKRKYRGIEWLVGHHAAMTAGTALPRLRTGVERWWDELMYRMSGQHAR